MVVPDSVPVPPTAKVPVRRTVPRLCGKTGLNYLFAVTGHGCRIPGRRAGVIEITRASGSRPMLGRR
jgi:hypothetical protein